LSIIPSGAGTAVNQITHWDGTNWVVGHPFTAGQLIFALASGAIGADSNLFWDNTQKRLGLGTSPLSTLDVNGIFTIHDTSGYEATLSRVSASPFRILSILSKGGPGYWQGEIDLNVNFNNGAAQTGIVIQAGATAASVGIGTTNPGAQLNVTSAIEIFQTAVLTPGSVGSLIVPINAGALTDALGGNLSGAHGLDTTNSKAYWRVGATWKGAALAGFNIPNYKWIPKYKGKKVVGYRKNSDKKNAVDETKCPLCKKQMKPKQALGMYADRWYNDKDSKEGLHALACHLSCAMKITGDR
jgi:hypothetical protein